MVGAERVDRTERLLNLVVCLMATTSPVSRERIFDVIPGYRDTQTPAALERMFERDKDDLRNLGIPLQTVTNVHGEVEGYRIALDEYVMPAIELTSAERGVVQIAAAAWQGAILEPAATMALAKIDAQDPGGEPVIADDVFLHFNSANTAMLQLMRALRLSRAVGFSYRRPHEREQKSRNMDPWGLVASEGHWYVVGYDHDRSEVRMFRLSRIVGNVRVQSNGIARACPEGFDVRAFVEGSNVDAADARASVWLQEGQGASVRRFMIEPGDVLHNSIVQVRAASWDVLRQQVCAAGQHAVVISPAEFRVSVIAGLQAVLDVHVGSRT